MELKYTKFKEDIEDFFLVSLKEYIYISILTILFVFLSFIGHIRTEPSPTFETDGLYVSYYGFPLEWFKIRSSLRLAWYTVTKFEILWVGLALDLTLYILLSLGLVHGVNKVKWKYGRKK